MASLNEETANKLRTQVEFYFSDSNLPRDEFLSKEVSKTKDGLVSLPLLCSFSRMRTLLGLAGHIKRQDIPHSVLEEVANILRTSDFLKVSEDGKRIGRGKKLSKPHKVLQQVDRRTIAASPFEYCIKMEDVASFFSQYAKVNSVRLPHHFGDKQFFCGTALVEFSSEQDTDSILKQSFVYAGADLELIPKADFDRQRQKMTEKLEESGSSLINTSENEFSLGQLLKFTLKRLATDDKVTKNEKRKNLKNEIRGKEDEASTTANLEGEDREKESGNSQADKSCASLGKEKVDDAETPPWDSSDSLGSDVLKDAFQRFGSVKHIEYSDGVDSGYVCFIDSETAMKARAAVEFVGGLIVKHRFSIALQALNGEMEKEVWKRLTAAEPQEESEEGRKEAYDKKGKGKAESFETTQPPQEV